MPDERRNPLPGFRPEDLPQPVLVDLVKAYGRLYLAMDGFWFLSAMNRLGEETALELDLWVWQRVAKYEMDRLTRLLNLEGRGVATLVKALQATPWFLNTEYITELEGADHAWLTFTRCPLLEALEKEGKGREKRQCSIVETAILQFYAGYFDPAIKVKSLVLPPREDKSGICCKWEFKLG